MSGPGAGGVLTADGMWTLQTIKGRADVSSIHGRARLKRAYSVRVQGEIAERENNRALSEVQE